MITVTALGANSVTLTYDSAATLLELIQEVEDYITTHGWSLWDINAGTNARAYRSLKQDGVKYNYIVLDWNTSGYVIMRAYESWDADAHTGLNQAMNTKSFNDMISNGFSTTDNTCNAIQTVAESAMQQPVSIGVGADLHVYCKSSYLIFVGVTLTQNGTAQGSSPTAFFEYSRDNSEDTAVLGIPSHGMLLCDNLIAGFLETQSNSYPNIPAGFVFAHCRLKNGNTGEDALRHSWFALPEMFWCSPKSYFRKSFGGFYYGRAQDWDPILSGDNNWSNKKLCSNIFVGYSGGVAEPELYLPNGRLYGAKIISSQQGSLNDIAKITIDGDGFFSIGGTLTDHLIIPLRDWGSNFAYRLRMAIPA